MNLIILCGPPGSGKSTLAKNLINDDGDIGAATIYVNQDSQGKNHLAIFMNALAAGANIIVDRMGFNKEQRKRYLEPAKKAGYNTEIIVLHESYDTCLSRILKRTDHETIKDEKTARSALQTFFTKYERPTLDEADKIDFRYPEGDKSLCLVIDLDGTLANCEHRTHLVRQPKDHGILGNLNVVDIVTGEGMPKPFKKDWKSFFEGIKDDTMNDWCASIIYRFMEDYHIVFCTGRDENYKKVTLDWLDRNLDIPNSTYSLFMRNRHDSRQDWTIKENILDFEILTKHKPYFMIDDRKQVVEMWRRRGFVCLQCNEGDF